MSKTHYRKVFKSDHLGRADLEDFIEEGRDLIFTITHVNQEIGAKVAGKKINANIAYFQEGIKPLVLNATNSGVMRNLTGSCFVENWQNVTVQLYIDKQAKLKGEAVGGVRISPNAVRKAKPVITPNNVNMWNNAKAAYLRDGNFSAVLKRADISEANQQLIIQEAGNA
jgi:hypothetical protein